MPELSFDCVDVHADPYAAGPTMVFRLRIAETTGERVHALALRCQLRIEPNRRQYTDLEARHLDDLFGDRSRWRETLTRVQLATVAVMVPSFTGSVEVDVPVPFTYDLDVAGSRYFHALETGDVAVLMLFSGTLIVRGRTGFEVSQVPWQKSASVRLPVGEWRRMMDAFFPDSGWLRLQRDTLDSLGEYKNRHALPTWEHAIRALLAAAEQPADGAR